MQFILLCLVGLLSLSVLYGSNFHYSQMLIQLPGLDLQDSVHMTT